MKIPLYQESEGYPYIKAFLVVSYVTDMILKRIKDNLGVFEDENYPVNKDLNCLLMRRLGTPHIDWTVFIQAIEHITKKCISAETGINPQFKISIYRRIL